jgi:YHS domain-containing protein
MIGAWKGTAVPRANRLKGWPENHLWAWKFSKGTPVGMTIELKGDKSLTKGQLAYDASTKTYTLEGTDSDGKPVTYRGAMDKAGKALVLDRTGETPEGKERLTLRPNSNHIRYQLLLDRAEPGAPQYKNVIEVGLTKEGESFAAGGAAADLPKCIVTGGAATLNVTFEGKTYPLCCTGCRDEFNENPAKYVKKALLRAQAGEKASVKPASSSGGKGDGEFDGLVDEPKAAKKMPAAKPAKVSAKSDDDETSSKDEDTDSAKTAKSKKAADPAAKVASLLSQAQALEKAGKSAPALVFYRRIVKEYPKSAQAKTAAERVKALEK